MTKFPRSARAIMATSLAMTLGLTLGGCGNGAEAQSGDGNLRFSWWGSDPLHNTTLDVIEDFEAENPDITVEGEYGEWGGYWDKLATMTAGRDAPDVINMDEKYLQEYAGRGALTDLSTLPGLDLSKFDESALELGAYEDGIYGLTTGQNAYVVMVNKDLFEEAGVELPDDTTWTWADYYALSAELAEKLGDESGTTYGAQEADLRIWLRQHGESLYGEETGVGYSAATAASWFEHLLDVRDEGGGMSAAQFTEEQSGAFEASSFPTNKAAMGWFWSNQLASLETATGSNIGMLRTPSVSGNVADNGMYYKSTMYWSISSQSDDQEAAAEFVNYLANNEDAAKQIMVDRGVPANPDMVAAIEPELSETEQTVVDFLEEIRPDMAGPEKISPVGAGGVQDVIKRYASEVLFDNLTPQQAAEQMTTEIEGLINA